LNLERVWSSNTQAIVIRGTRVAKGRRMVSDGEDKGTTPVRGRPFKQGESGNPAGRPVGSKSMTKLLMERLDGRAEELIDALIDRALKGDGAATKIISDRVMPVQRGSFVDFDLPERLPDGSMDMVKVQESLLEAVAAGKVTPADAAHLSMIFDKIMSARNEAYFHDKVFEAVTEVERIGKLVK